MKILDKKSYFKLIVNDSILLICAFLIFTNLPRKDLDYDLNTEIGQLQQEILDKYNVATYYNYDINHDVTSIFFGLSHNKDKNITEKEALNSLKKIDKVLSLYSGNYPRCVYLVNDLKVKNENVGGLFINIRNIIVLNNYFSLTNDFHHEMGHCIEDKTFDIKTLYRFKEADESCNMISSYACTSGDEMFAETWAYAIYDGATALQSLCLSNVF